MRKLAYGKAFTARATARGTSSLRPSASEPIATRPRWCPRASSRPSATRSISFRISVTEAAQAAPHVEAAGLGGGEEGGELGERDHAVRLGGAGPAGAARGAGTLRDGALG